MRGFIFALLLVVTLQADSGQYLRQLLHNASSATHPQTLLWQAVQQNSLQARQRLIDESEARQDEYWLQQLVSLGDADAAWTLYQMLGEEQASDRFMRIAARGNVPEAQFNFAFSTDDPTKRKTWLLRAAEQDYVPAQAALADWYLLMGQTDEARPWLMKTAERYPKKAYELGRLLWSKNRKDALVWLNYAAEKGELRAQKLVSVIERYNNFNPSRASAKWSTSKVCQQRIQPFASSLNAIAHADSLYQRFTADQRLKSVDICVAKPIWLQDDSLSCQANSRSSYRITCNLAPLAPVIDRTDATHAVIVVDEGKANTHNGVMFLDTSDSYSVFVHELAHFAGFIDEYELSKSAAEVYCFSQFDAPNLVYQQADGEFSPNELVSLWRWLEPTAVMTTAKTCRAVDVATFKPSTDMTFLEHHDTGNIPAIYRKLWQHALYDERYQRPIYINLKQTFQRQNEPDKADYWAAKTVVNKSLYLTD